MHAPRQPLQPKFALTLCLCSPFEIVCRASSILSVGCVASYHTKLVLPTMEPSGPFGNVYYRISQEDLQLGLAKVKKLIEEASNNNVILTKDPPKAFSENLQLYTVFPGLEATSNLTYLPV